MINLNLIRKIKRKTTANIERLLKMNNQIDSSQNNMGGGFQQPNVDREKLDMMDKANEFMNNTEIKKRIK